MNPNSNDLQQQTNQNEKENQPPLKTSKMPKDCVRIKPEKIPVPFKRSLISTVLCFFTIGPCWALYKTFQLRRLIQQQETDAANRLSNQISVVLIFSTIIGFFVWIGILFVSVGIMLTGIMSNAKIV